MARIHLVASVPAGLPTAADTFRQLAARSSAQRHALTLDPDEADIIVFPDAHVIDRGGRIDEILSHPLHRQFADRCVIYDERDRPWLSLPGAYVSMPARRMRPSHQFSFGFVNASLPASYPDLEPDLLASFVGRRSDPWRSALMAVPARSRVEVRDTTGFMFWDIGAEGHADLRRSFDETIARSKYVICPRGAGASSIRLFETLAAGRVPVVVSDDWVPPQGPDWSSCSVRWPESGNPEALLDRLADEEGLFEERAAAATKAFDEWFAPAVAFDRLVEGFVRVLAAHAVEPLPNRGVRDGEYWRLRASALRGQVIGRLKPQSTDD